MAEIPVNGKVLAWARIVRGLDIDRAAELLGVSPDELRDYESGAKKPLIGFLRHMSSKYQINFTSLLMPTPLPIPKPPADYRIRFGRQPLSIISIVAREDISEALETFTDIAGEFPSVVPKLKIGTAALTDDPELVASNERRRLGVSIEEQQGWGSLGTARRRWRERVEERGIFTYMVAMPVEELSGFSLLQGELAAICINDNEATEGAKIFTLFHEYCHLLLRQTGISDQNEENEVEKFCNRFAASFLIPKQALLQLIGDVSRPCDFSDRDVKRFSNRFKVSNSAMALRLEKLKLAPKGFYDKHSRVWDMPVVARQPSASQQPSPIKIRIKQIGKLHAATVLGAVRRGAINSFDASQLIGLQPSTFPKIEAALG